MTLATPGYRGSGPVLRLWSVTDRPPGEHANQTVLDPRDPAESDHCQRGDYHDDYACGRWDGFAPWWPRLPMAVRRAIGVIMAPAPGRDLSVRRRGRTVWLELGCEHEPDRRELFAVGFVALTYRVAGLNLSDVALDYETWPSQEDETP